MSSSSESKPSSAAVASSSKSKTKSSASTSTFLWNAVWVGIALYVFTVVAKAAYHIRMGAINEYGPVIHEFDPYFNYRATEYLYWNGWQRFFQWFDRKVWYPLGRPVGTTIYPGMQFTAVWIKQYLLPDMSLNDICCYIPAWFGVLATIMTGLLAYECSIPWNTNRHLGHFILDMYYGTFTTKNGRNLGEKNTALKGGGKGGHGGWSPALECGLFAMAMMSIVPAHLMRSMGGGYDNESVAISAMVTTFYFWTRSLRNHDPYAYVFGILAGLAYFYMVAAWGGYVFVLNLIGVHAAVLVLLGRFSTKTYLAYTFFYAIGTTLAIQVPVVGMAPLKSLEQLGPFAVFLGYQLLMVLERIIQARQYDRKQAWTFRIQGFIVAGALLTMIAMFLTPKGYFGPISSRVRGLFVKHTKTGNPLVDSVAEHQPASSRAYFQYLHHVCSLAPLGYMVVFFKLSDASSFLLVWGTAAYFFSHKMVRLILLTAPIGCILGGIAAGRIFAWCVEQWWDDSAGSESEDTIDNAITTDESNKKKKGKIGKKTPPADSTSLSSFEGLAALQSAARSFSKSKEGVVTKKAISVLFLIIGYVAGIGFVRYCWRLSQDLSNPTILMKARLRDGKIITLDDYREAYWWLRDNTAEDARIMAWWDYGYQISAIANRTTIADGNTWNHEHIALLGLALTTDLEVGWEIARHLADYVLIWGGGGGDDLAKSPHLARIANSVYRHHCPDDPTCRSFGVIDRQGTPSSMMRRSLLYNLHGHGMKEGVTVSEDRFREVYRSKYGKVRIYKIMGVDEDSKKWVADPSNWKCDAPGSWYCPGQYPPALKPFLDSKIDFAQLEDFNRGTSDEEYQKKYFEHLQNPDLAKKILEKERQEILKQKKQEESSMTESQKEAHAKTIDEIYHTWEDTEDTVRMYNLIKNNQVKELQEWLQVAPEVAYVRSKDGRGPMFWAFELRNEEVTKILMKAGVPHTDKDGKGLTPLDLLEGVKDRRV